MTKNDVNIIMTLLIMILSKMSLTAEEKKVLDTLTEQLAKEARL